MTYVEAPGDGKRARHEFPQVSVDDAYGNLKALNVRGGGRVARYGVQALRNHAKDSSAKTPADYWRPILTAAEKLKSSRPTAVTLTNAIDYVLNAGGRSLESGD